MVADIFDDFQWHSSDLPPPPPPPTTMGRERGGGGGRRESYSVSLAMFIIIIITTVINIIRQYPRKGLYDISRVSFDSRHYHISRRRVNSIKVNPI